MLIIKSVQIAKATVCQYRYYSLELAMKGDKVTEHCGFFFTLKNWFRENLGEM